LRSNAASGPPVFSPQGCSIFAAPAALLVVHGSIKDISLSSRLAGAANFWQRTLFLFMRWLLMTKRLFVAIDLPATVAQQLRELDPKVRGVHWMPFDQLHLTLGFFAQVSADAESTLREKLGQIQFHAFFLPIVGVGTFPPKGPPKIIWIGVGKGHPHLFQIYKRVQEAALAAGLEPELRPWHPHITLARCRDVSGQSVKNFLRDNADADLGLIRVESFHLYSSKLAPAGAIHTRELTIPCTGGLSL
jgi:2'-5' RNA ligase